jgi:hypothetical protein
MYLKGLAHCSSLTAHYSRKKLAGVERSPASTGVNSSLNNCKEREEAASPFLVQLLAPLLKVIAS